jgi:methionyl-tRNA formyltransferase
MQENLRIIFMGTPDFAAHILKEMVASGKNVVGIITAPDKPAGRGQKVMGSAVKAYAQSQNLKILQPTNLKDPAFLEQLKELNPHVQVVVAFRMLPKVVWQIPPLGTFNLHASLLPHYRGAAPINWAIINKEEKTGVTTFFIDEKIDTGAIIASEEVSIETDETAATLHDKLMIKGADLVLETLRQIEKGTVATKPQPTNPSLKEAPKLTSENTRIDWNWAGEKIDAFIRGLSPYPVAWTQLQNNGETLKVKIYAGNFEPEPTIQPSGTIVATKKTLKVACSNGFIFIKELQLPGKRKMDIVSLLNGYVFDGDSKMC